ncbi:MAG: hypothetical protein ACREV9_13195 [Burkholderiales bacterium]
MTTRKELDGIAELEAAADTVIGLARHSLCIFSSRLSVAYNSPARSETLRRFLLANARNRLRIALHDCAGVPRDFPRLIALLRVFSHNMEIFETGDEAKTAYDEIVIADASRYLHRFHFNQARGELVLHDESGARELEARFEEIWLTSRPAITATTLGL